MSEVATGIAELGQGALTARAIEPGAGAASDGHTHESACLNCGTRLVGTHCHRCGQAAHVHRTLAAFFHDLAHGVLHVEGKVWRTLPLLVLNPGRLTREYIDGRRASYLSPIALFLFAAFLLFAVFHLVERPSGAARGVYTSPRQAIAAQNTRLAKLRRERAAATTPARAAALDRDIADTRKVTQELEGLHASGFDVTTDASDGKSGTGMAWLDRAIARVRANPDLALYKLQMSAYKYSWLLIPISVPLVWLLFPFSRRFRLYDHTVFVTYSLAFMTLLATVLSLVGLVASALAGMLAFVVPPVHMFRQLRGAYALGRWAALWRTAALVVLGFAALMLFALGLASLEVVG